MKTVLRAVVTLLATASIVLAGAGSVHAADPDTIGITVDPGLVNIDTSRVVTVTNEGTVPMDFAFVAPDGWTVTPNHLDAVPVGESGQVRLDGYGASGRLDVSGTASRPDGTSAFGDASVIVMSVRIGGGNPLRDALPYIVGLLVALGLVLLLWRTKPWQIRLTRATR